MISARSVLLVDDSSDDLLIAKMAIARSHANCHIETAMSGTETIKRLKDDCTPSVIFLDLKMPIMDGIDILRYIRSHDSTRYIPVIMLSSSRVEGDIKDCYIAGANGYLYKTHDLTDFIILLKTAIHYWIDFNITPC